MKHTILMVTLSSWCQIDPRRDSGVVESWDLGYEEFVDVGDGFWS